jgi:hypothetical protein
MQYMVLLKYKHEYEDAHSKVSRHIVGVDNRGMQLVECSPFKYDEATVGQVVELPDLSRTQFIVSPAPDTPDIL